MASKPPIGRIVHNTNTGKTVGADMKKFNDSILVSEKVDVSRTQNYLLSEGDYTNKKLCVNRYNFHKHS